MTIRSEIPPLIAGVILALAGVALAAAHVAVPDYLTNSAVVLLGIAGGATLPGRSAAALPSSPPASSSAPEPVAGEVHQLVTAAGAHSQHAAAHADTARAAAREAGLLLSEIRTAIASSSGAYPKPQVAPPTPTPPGAPIAAPGPAEPHAGGLS